ncbi:hypothetical protein HYH02_014411 [Chlamydomonas schloesseri]|uniref:Uncharacterized protein n=1 Tax=Chlamydomonas schloesseri TaxID=2026947 RepID=A0A835SJM2_9CHLO|nr:hypothetical protein HYH02_014411 [Chlamydomonas schloesseri]|eukprot:KAG2428229.1 hypothetical protein HYH02_014411 [Chlamydomonas schloesseri]
MELGPVVRCGIGTLKRATISESEAHFTNDGHIIFTAYCVSLIKTAMQNWQSLEDIAATEPMEGKENNMTNRVLAFIGSAINKTPPPAITDFKRKYKALIAAGTEGADEDPAPR